MSYMLSFRNKPFFMLSVIIMYVIMLSAIMLNVVAPCKLLPGFSV